MRFYAIAILFFQSSFLHAQRDIPIRQRIFQLSIVPGLGTNGTQPGSYENYFSINLMSGYSASALLFEIATLSNLNTNRTRGLQMAGLVNLTGGNAFGGLSKKERDEKIKSGFSSYLNGAQISGLTNLVLDNVYGIQITGGANVVKGHMLGAQLSGLSNVVYEFSFGAQLSGLFNVSVASMDGVQIAGLSNYTKGQMAGLQLSAINQAGDIEGKNSYDNAQPTGIQIGLLNIARKMNGFQVGLINFAKQSQGTQIGLINFYRGGKQSETKDGTAIGLLNFGDLDYVSFYANEIFRLNYEFSTGTRKNSRIKMTRRNVYVTNAIIYSHQAMRGDDWGIGYGLKKMYFNRSELPGMTESRFFSYGFDAQHINSEKGEVARNLSLLTRLKFMVGKRIAPKWFGVNWYAAVSLNAYWNDNGDSIAPDFLSSSTTVKKINLEYWPGVSAGFLFH